jgi:hypothetical protein
MDIASRMIELAAKSNTRWWSTANGQPVYDNTLARMRPGLHQRICSELAC